MRAVSSLVMVILVGLMMRRPGGCWAARRWVGSRAKFMYSGGVGSAEDASCGPLTVALSWPALFVSCAPPGGGMDSRDERRSEAEAEGWSDMPEDVVCELGSLRTEWCIDGAGTASTCCVCKWAGKKDCCDGVSIPGPNDTLF